MTLIPDCEVFSSLHKYYTPKLPNSLLTHGMCRIHKKPSDHPLDNFILCEKFCSTALL